MNKIYTLIILNLACFNLLLSAQTASIHGRITELKTGEPLAGVTIRLEETSRGAVTNSEGFYDITKLKPGKYRIMISYIGYKTIRKDFDLFEGDNYEYNAVMEEKLIQTGEVIVSASKRVQSVQEVPVSVSVITAQSLDQRNITSLGQALQYVPGVNMNGEDVSIRGSAGFAFGLGSRVTLLLDGFPMLAGDQGDMKLNALPLFDVERVEVVKGAGSALYGTSALGGVVNVITRKAVQKPEIKARMFTGIYTKPRYEGWVYSDDYHFNSGAELGYMQKFNGLSLVLSGNYIKNDSYRKFDDSKRYNIYLKTGYEFSEYTDAFVAVDAGSENHADWVYWNSLDSATIPPDGTNLKNRYTSDKLFVMGNVRHVFDDNNFMVFKTGVFNTVFYNNLPMDSADYRGSIANSYNTELQVNNKLAKHLLLTSGVNYILNKVNSFSYGNEIQQIFSGYTQAELSHFYDLNLTAGVRYDYEKTSRTDFSPELSPKFGVIWNSPFDWIFRASVGRGFRAPTVAERYASINFQGFSVRPNLALKPETSFSYEIGTSYDGSEPFFGGPVAIDISAFRNDLYDLIEPTLIDTLRGTVMFKNITRARISGIEVSLRTFVAGIFGLESSLTLMDPRDLTLNQTLKYRHNVLWYNSVSLPLGPVELQADYRYLSKVKNIDNLLQFQVKDYNARVPVHVVDARVILDLKKLAGWPLKLTLNAKNLLDYYYTEMVGNLAPTRYIGLQIDAGI